MGRLPRAAPARLPGVRFWPDRRTVWRWHVLSGLFCLPFVCLLCLSGTVYLFRPQVDRWLERSYDDLPIAGPAATPREQVGAALAAVPGSRLLAFELPRSRTDAARVIVDRGGTAIRVFVHPATAAVLGRVREERRFERIVFELHGQLLLGNAGSVVMEMVASWTVVLILTGLFLWWPCRAPAGFPRPAAGNRGRWRRLHGWTGASVSALLALFLVSGLPWSFVWGHALARVEAVAARLHPLAEDRPEAVREAPGWEIGARPMREVVAGEPFPAAAGAMPGMDMGPAAEADAERLDGLDAVVAAARRLRFPPPVLVTPPAGTDAAWRVRSDTQDRPRRVSALVSPSGTVLSTERFADKPAVDRLVGYGVALHEGQLFGWPNQLLNLLVACGLLLMSVAALVLWLGRRPPGSFGVPDPAFDRRAGIGAVAVMVLLGVLLPELGAALLFLVLLARLLPDRVGVRAGVRSGVGAARGPDSP